MKEDKARCYIMYQIFSSLHASVIENIQKARWYSVSFDKSFNHVREISQMSVNIWYWNKIKHIVETTYLISWFFLHPSAENLKDELFEGRES